MFIFLARKRCFPGCDPGLQLRAGLNNVEMWRLGLVFHFLGDANAVFSEQRSACSL